MWYNAPMEWSLVAGWYVPASAATFAAFWIDKRRAARSLWRVPEATLHLMELAGGWPGALLAIKLVRHKSSKPAYWIVTWLIAVVHGAMWALWLWRRS